MNGRLPLALTVAGAAIVVMDACNNAPASTPSPAPAKTEAAQTIVTSAPAKSNAVPTAAADTNRSQSVEQGIPLAGMTDWSADWEKTLAAAKKEGKVVACCARGDQYSAAAAEFHQAYPDIAIDYTGMAGRDATPKILAERRGGQYLLDVYIGGAPEQIASLRPNNVLTPLRPALTLPEVLEDGKWQGGFDDGWMDQQGQYVYGFLGFLDYTFQVNRDVTPESELSSMNELLEPKWKGKIAWQDPRTGGAGGHLLQNLFIVKGEEWVRKLLANEIVVLSDSRMILDGLVRGRYAVAVGLREDEVQQFKKAGLGQHLAIIEPDTPAGAAITAGSGHVSLVDKAPHPNAAKVFVNWALSRAGQKAYVGQTGIPSRRLDVENPTDSAPKPGVSYVNTQKEEYLATIARAAEIAKEMLK